MVHIAWLGKKSPFCGNVTYGLSTTEALRARGHAVSFIHFDTPAGALGRHDISAELHERRTGGSGDNPEVTLPYLVKSQVYTIPSPGAQRELRESLERLRPDLVHASLTLSPLDFRLPDLCQQLGLPLVATFHPAFDAGLRNLVGGTQQLTYQLYAPSLARFDRVIVFSELQAELLERLGVRRERLAVIPNGVDNDLWSPAPRTPGPVLSDLRRRYADRPAPRHLWFGVSVEDAQRTSRIDHLRAAPAAVRFLSIEPLIGPLGRLDLGGIHWAILGGESGPGARPLDPAWVRDVRDQCVAAGTAFFFKQWGGLRPKAGGRSLDGREWNEFPATAPADRAA